MDKNGYWVEYVSVSSWIVNNWCNDVVSPYPILAIVLIEVTSFLETVSIVDIPEALINEVSSLAVFSDPSGWPELWNL